MLEIDATDELEFPDGNPATAQAGVFPALSALETIVYPTSAQLQANNELAGAGTLEILPMESALTLFVWSKNRIVPVRITDFSITEEAFGIGCRGAGTLQTWRVSGRRRMTPLDSFGVERDRSSALLCSAHYFDARDGLIAQGF